jgi:5-methylcytosine-specific restriction endonuclease McrA
VPIRPELRHLYRGPAWEAARAACRERAKDRCQHCKRKNGSLKTKPRVVEIQCGAAHLNGVAGDDRPENLAWLCRGCHLRHDRWFHHLSRAARKDAGRPLLAALEARP